tara:strand:+ start:261 stop:677 length:417 start_codon:yes stop_codon:yes gene_type:complete
MNKSDLINKIQLTLDDSFKESNFSIDPNIEKFIDALLIFESKASQEIFFKTFEVLRNSILEESNSSGYFVTKNAKFGDFKDIRNVGFYRRYLYNVKLTPTYIKAYQLTENEYVETFGKNRYSSYDSFRIIKNRINSRE